MKIIGAGAYCINQNVLIYTNDNIDRFLMDRYVNKKARIVSKKNRIKGPAKRTREDDERFLIALKKLIISAKTGGIK